MEGEILQLPNNLIGWGTILGVAVIGFFGLLNIFDKGLRLRRNQADAVEDKLINRLEKQVQTLEKDVAIFKSKYDDAVIRLDKATLDMQKVTAENSRLSSILAEKDDATMDYRNRALAAMQRSDETNKLVKGMAETVEHLATTLDKYFSQNGARKVEKVEITAAPQRN